MASTNVHENTTSGGAKSERRVKASAAVPPDPSEVLKQAKAKMEASLKQSINSQAGQKEYTEASKAIADIPVSITLGELCRLMGPDCQPDEFATTAMQTLAAQLDAVSTVAENGECASYDAWQVVTNITERMRFAATVAKRLESKGGSS